MIEKLLGLVITVLILIATAFMFALLVMWLWNAVMPDLFGFHQISFFQALGLSWLSALLFGQTRP